MERGYQRTGFLACELTGWQEGNGVFKTGLSD